MLEGTQAKTRGGLLSGKTVWIVEPERFSAHALETALDDLHPETIVHVASVDEARTRLERMGPGGAPALAVIDFTGEGDARMLASDLSAHGATVVRTVPANGLSPLPGHAPPCGTGDAPAMPDMRRPYAPAEVARAIARHYGLTT